MYVSGVSGGPTGQDLGPKSGASSLPPTWNKGTMSKRFDVKDEATKTSSVSLFPLTRFQLIPPQSSVMPSPMKSSITNDDEKAAVAAMFQAQTANWEETQEKMSQLVLPRVGFVIVVDFSLMNIAFSPLLFFSPVRASRTPPVLNASIPTLVVPVLHAGEPSLIRIFTINLRSLCLLAMYVTAVDKKVRFFTLSAFPLLRSIRPLDTRLPNQ